LGGCFRIQSSSWQAATRLFAGRISVRRRFCLCHHEPMPLETKEHKELSHLELCVGLIPVLFGPIAPLALNRDRTWGQYKPIPTRTSSLGNRRVGRRRIRASRSPTRVFIRCQSVQNERDRCYIFAIFAVYRRSGGNFFYKKSLFIIYSSPTSSCFTDWSTSPDIEIRQIASSYDN
jgi:hypothetical protein